MITLCSALVLILNEEGHLLSLPFEITRREMKGNFSIADTCERYHNDPFGSGPPIAEKWVDATRKFMGVHDDQVGQSHLIMYEYFEYYLPIITHFFVFILVLVATRRFMY